jgi:hypothetical protein
VTSTHPRSRGRCHTTSSAAPPRPSGRICTAAGQTSPSRRRRDRD